MHGGRTNAKPLGIGEILADIAIGDLGVVHPFLIGAADHLIIDIGKVLYKGDLVPAILKVAAEHIKDDEAARVADVEEVIDGRPAGVHLDLSLLDRNEGLTACCQGIVKADHG